jgi:hypothetical protein
MHLCFATGGAVSGIILVLGLRSLRFKGYMLAVPNVGSTSLRSCTGACYGLELTTVYSCS